MMSLQSKPVLFKEVWTNNVRQFHVNPYWTVTQFIESVRPHLAREFNTQDFDIVESGQNVHNIVSETAPALEYSNVKIHHKWGKNLNVSFYIRKNDANNQSINTQEEVEEENQNQEEENPLLMDECPICYENIMLLRMYECEHRICKYCFKKCNIINYNICPICRNG
jgi:hypothetical protein